MQKILDSKTVNGSSIPFRSDGGPYIFDIRGTFGGRTVTIESSPDGSADYKSKGSDSEVEADKQVVVQTAQGEYVRVTVSGSGTTPSIDAWMGPAIRGHRGVLP